MSFQRTSVTSGAGTAYPSRALEFTPPVFSWIRVTRSLVLYVCFVDRCLSFCTFSFRHCVILFFFDIRILITSLLYLQTLHILYIIRVVLQKRICLFLKQGIWIYVCRFFYGTKFSCSIYSIYKGMSRIFSYLVLWHLRRY